MALGWDGSYSVEEAIAIARAARQAQQEVKDGLSSAVGAESGAASATANLNGSSLPGHAAAPPAPAAAAVEPKASEGDAPAAAPASRKGVPALRRRLLDEEMRPPERRGPKDGFEDRAWTHESFGFSTASYFQMPGGREAPADAAPPDFVNDVLQRRWPESKEPWQEPPAAGLGARPLGVRPLGIRPLGRRGPASEQAASSGWQDSPPRAAQALPPPLRTSLEAAGRPMEQQAAPPSPPELPALIAGGCVRIVGLRKHEDLNGVLGELVEEKDEARWEVRLGSGLGHKLFKAKNLERLPEAMQELVVATASGDPALIKAARDAAKQMGVSEKDVAQIYGLFSSSEDVEDVD